MRPSHPPCPLLSAFESVKVLFVTAGTVALISIALLALLSLPALIDQQFNLALTSAYHWIHRPGAGALHHRADHAGQFHLHSLQIRDRPDERHWAWTLRAGVSTFLLVDVRLRKAGELGASEVRFLPDPRPAGRFDDRSS